MELDDRTKRALFRLEVIAPLISGRLEKHELAAIRQQVLSRVYETPDGRSWQVAERTLRTWLKRHREGGFNGLFDGDRGTYGTNRALDEAVLQAAMALRKQESSLSIPQILDLLKYSEGVDAASVEKISKATLNRQLNKRGAVKNKPKQEAGTFQRWQQKFVNDIWQGDCSDGVWLPDPTNPKILKKTQLISFIDDASRVVPHAQFYWDTKLPSLLDCFRKALLKRGRPERTYCDNAWIYHSTTLKVLCAELDIKPSFCTVRRPPGKGKIERHIYTVQAGFYKVAEHAGIQTLDELNQFFFAWLSGKYHKTVHSELNDLSPMDRWNQDRERIKRVSPAELRRGLMLRCVRTVNRKTATVRVDNNVYQGAFALAGEKVEVRFHFNDDKEVEIWQRGKLIETAFPVKVEHNIDFSKRPKKGEEPDKRGTTYPAFKAYRLGLVAQEKPEFASFVQPSDLIAQPELIDLFVELLGRPLTESDLEFLTKFFLQHSPFHKASVQERLMQTIEAAGSQLHIRAYCERLLDTVIQRRR
jgi:transposase InsO family protein